MHCETDLGEDMLEVIHKKVVVLQTLPHQPLDHGWLFTLVRQQHALAEIAQICQWKVREMIS
jgi:hypothetical protein